MATTKKKAVKGTKKAVKMATNKAIASPYTATIKIMGKLFTAVGATPSDAILGLNLGNTKGIAVLSIKHEDKVQEKIFQPRIIFQLFNGSETMRAIALKNVAMRFDL